VSNDDSVSRGVLTNDGQTAVRDTLADNNPDLPTDYAYGSDGSAVSESDTALGNQLKQVSITDLLVQNADTDSEWSSITTIANDKPFTVSNSQLQTVQSAFVSEAEDERVASIAEVTDADYSNGSGVVVSDSFGTDNDVFSFGVNPQYDITNAKFAMRNVETGDAIAFDVTVDGTTVASVSSNSTLSWAKSGSFNLPSGSHTVSIDANFFSSSSSEVEIDVIAVYDDDFTYDFDNQVGSNGYLNGPQLYPDNATLTLEKATFERNITEGSFDSTWNDLGGNQSIAISPDASTFTAFDNTSSASFTFTNVSQSITSKFTFDRFGIRTTETPTIGFKGQAVDLWELFVDPDTPSPDDIGVTNARAIVPPNSGLNGETVREAGLKSGSTLLTRHQLAEFVVAQDQRLASSEQTKFTGDE
jgi:hypothetical protein